MAALAEKYRRDLLKLVDRFEMADSTLSRTVFGADSEFIKRLRNDLGVTSRKMAVLEDYLVAHWPERQAELRRERAAGSASAGHDRHLSS